MKKLVRFLFAAFMLVFALPTVVLVVWASTGEDTFKETVTSIFEDWQRYFWESV